MRVIRPANLLFALMGACLLTTALAPLSAARAADADKVVTSGSGPYGSGDIVNLQIRVPYPDEISANPIEVVIAVDASGSMTDDIEDAKVPLTNFAHSLADYPGMAKVSIVSFGRRDDGDSAQDPNLDMIFSLRSINDSGDINALVSGINSLSTSDSQVQYTDIRSGIIYANQQFSSSSNVSARYLAVLTDGVHNMPAPDTNIFGITGFNGQCVLTKPYPASPYTGDPNMSGLDYDYFDIIPGGDISEHLTTDASDVPNSGYKSPCDYPHDDPNAPTGSQYINMMATAFPNAERKLNMGDAIDTIERLLIPVSFSMTDYINTDVFSEVVSVEEPRNCSTNQPFPDIPGVGDGGTTILGDPHVSLHSEVVNGITNAGICIRFRARVSSEAESGTPNINSASNYVQFRNELGDIISRSKVKNGSIAIQNEVAEGSGDVKIDYLSLYGPSGGAKQIFMRNERIYFATRIHNVSSEPSKSDFYSYVYDDNPGGGLASRIHRTGSIDPGGLATYDSRNPSSPNYDEILSPTYWTMDDVGDFQAKVAINNNTDANPANNNGYKEYTVLNPPNLSVANVSCSSAVVSWTSTPGVTYDLTLSPTASGNDVDNIAGSSLALHNLAGSTNYTVGIYAETSNGRSSQLDTITFTTDAPCPPTKGLDLITEPNLEIHAGSERTTSVGIEYLPDGSAWSSSDRLWFKLLGIMPAGSSCPTNASAGVVTVGSGSASDISAGVDALGSGYKYFYFDTSTKSVVIDVGAGVPLGTYKVCLGLMLTGHIETQTVNAIPFTVTAQNPWLQVTRGGVAGSMAGDVHSNGDISFVLPAGLQLFDTGVAGVVSANSDISLTASEITNLSQNRWRAEDYQRAVRTPGFDDLESVLLSNLADGALLDSFNQTQINNACAAHSTVAVSLDSLANTSIIDTASIPNCAGHNLIIIISGNLSSTANIINSLNNDTTLTFLVGGDITIDPAVTQLDGAYLFGGTFDDGGGNQQLQINGSLIGLTGDSPSVGTGAMSLRRSLGGANANTPAMVVAYQPQYLFKLQSILGAAKYSWTEQR